jgi:hypothetical protein
MSDELKNSDLKANQIPDMNSEYFLIAEFALTFNGYEKFERVAEFANNNLAAYNLDRESLKKRTLTELRACLFYEQRRYRHMDEEPINGDREYINALLTGIFKRVQESKTE